METRRSENKGVGGSRISRIIPIFAALLALTVADAGAHCDTMNGPVVKAARTALDSGDVRFVLPWVKPADEPEVRLLFDSVATLRTQGELARSISDRLFLETVVRLHRSGEGAPFTGLKDSQEPFEPGIAEAENSIEQESPEHLYGELSGMLHEGLERAFHRLRSARGYPMNDVQAGRRYVEAYVEYIHQVEVLYRVLGTTRTLQTTESEPHQH